MYDRGWNSLADLDRVMDSALGDSDNAAVPWGRERKCWKVLRETEGALQIAGGHRGRAEGDGGSTGDCWGGENMGALEETKGMLKSAG